MRRRGRVTIAALVATATVLATGCGVPLDNSPRAVLATTTTIATDGGPAAGSAEVDDGDITAFLFFIANNQLINLDQEITSREPADALTALFAGVPPGASEDVLSQIPTGTRLLGVRQLGTLLVVDVSTEFDNLVGTGRSQATAQIVMTATDLEGIDQVSLRIEGQPTQVFSQIRGDTDQVGACDYLGLMPTEELVASWPLDRRARQHLVTRRNMLLAQCPAPPSSDN